MMVIFVNITILFNFGGINRHGINGLRTNRYRNTRHRKKRMETKTIEKLNSLTSEDIDELYEIYCNPPKNRGKSLKWFETPCKNCPYMRGGCVCYNKTLTEIANIYGTANPYILLRK